MNIHVATGLVTTELLNRAFLKIKQSRLTLTPKKCNKVNGYNIHPDTVHASTFDLVKTLGRDVCYLQYSNIRNTIYMSLLIR